MSKVDVAKLFVRVKAPYLFVPVSGKKAAARIARDFVAFIDGLIEGYNENHGTSYNRAQGMVMVLESNLDPSKLFDQYRGIAETAKGSFITQDWSGQKGFDEGWKWMTDEFARWFIWNILEHPYEIDEFHTFEGAPELKKVLIEHPKGEKFVIDFVTAFRGFLYPGH